MEQNFKRRRVALSLASASAPNVTSEICKYIKSILKQNNS